VIPENVQKKAARDAKLVEARKNDLATAKKERAEKRKVYVANAEKYAKEYAENDRKLIEARRAAKADGGFFVEDEAKIAFVIRIRG
jgi:large subunit ribosomal protein L7e